MKGEAGLQTACVEWFKLQYPKLAPLLFHVPNGGAFLVKEIEWG